MVSENPFLEALRETKILRPPKHHLSTFGTTSLRYVLLSAVPESERQCRLRLGAVTASRPQIITAETWKKRFEGFGEEGSNFASEMERAYGDALRSLEYTFKNELQSTSLEQASLPDMADQTLKRMTEEDAPRTALLQGPDKAWNLAVMKFIVEASLRSFPSNVREMEDRGMFDPGGAENRRRRREIERLFLLAQSRAETVPELGARLKEWGLFGEYEDRFFSLVPRK